jgi:hypothetical protein
LFLNLLFGITILYFIPYSLYPHVLFQNFKYTFIKAYILLSNTYLNNKVDKIDPY